MTCTIHMGTGLFPLFPYNSIFEFSKERTCPRVKRTNIHNRSARACGYHNQRWLHGTRFDLVVAPGAPCIACVCALWAVLQSTSCQLRTATGATARTRFAAPEANCIISRWTSAACAICFLSCAGSSNSISRSGRFVRASGSAPRVWTFSSHKHMITCETLAKRSNSIVWNLRIR